MPPCPAAASAGPCTHQVCDGWELSLDRVNQRCASAGKTSWPGCWGAKATPGAHPWGGGCRILEALDFLLVRVFSERWNQWFQPWAGSLHHEAQPGCPSCCCRQQCRYGSYTQRPFPRWQTRRLAGVPCSNRGAEVLIACAQSWPLCSSGAGESSVTQ